jgi:hypothetical protein
MLARDERDRLLGAMVELYENGGGDARARVGRPSHDEPSADVFEGLLSAEERELVESLSEALAQIAARAAANDNAADPPAFAISGALGGADWVMRSEIVAGRAERLPQLMPEFAYLVTLPLLGHREAMHRRRQAEELVAEVVG